MADTVDIIVDGVAMTIPKPPVIPQPDPAPPTVSPLQMRRALRAAGLKPQVDAYVLTLDEEAREAWEYATEVRRNNALIAAAGAALGKTDAELDDLFRLAGSFVD